MNIIVAREKSRVMLSEDAVLVFLLFLLNTLVGLLYILGLFLLVRLKRGEGERERERETDRERERERLTSCVSWLFVRAVVIPLLYPLLIMSENALLTL